MISETKQAVDHTTWETFPFLFQQQWQLGLQHCAKVVIANFSEIRQNSRISRGNTGKFRCIYCSVVREIRAKFRAMRRTVIAKIRLGRTKIWVKTNN